MKMYGCFVSDSALTRIIHRDKVMRV